jgi:hypothetical protein
LFNDLPLFKYLQKRLGHTKKRKRKKDMLKCMFQKKTRQPVSQIFQGEEKIMQKRVS